jgi:hypothetical protein
MKIQNLYTVEIHHKTKTANYTDTYNYLTEEEARDHYNKTGTGEGYTATLNKLTITTHTERLN